MRLLTVVILSSLLCGVAMAKTLHVSPTGSGADGMSWETAFPTVHAAMLAAASGDHVWVRSATYDGNIQMSTGVSLFGGFAGTEGSDGFHLRDWKDNPTTLSGVGPIIKLANYTAVDGFTIRNDLSSGGGILVHSATGLVKNCLISKNRISGIWCLDSKVSILDCEIYENEGGGIACQDSDVNIERCMIINNTNLINSHGGGVIVSDLRHSSSVYIICSQIIGNYTKSETGVARGGGIYSSGTKLILDRCVIARNVARGRIVPFGGGSDGGAIYSLADVNATLTNCLIEGNEALRGSVFSIGQDSIYRLNSCTLFSNEEVSIDRVNELWMSSSILYSNAGVEISGTNKRFISFSNVKGGAPGIGNIDADPLFLNTLNSNLRLQVGSPCIDSGSMDGPSTDLDGSPRPFDVPGIGRDGPGAFDMGAYEFIVPTPAPTLVNDRSDVNRSGEVNAYDLLILIADWKKTTGTL